MSSIRSTFICQKYFRKDILRWSRHPSPVFWSFVQVTNLNQIVHLLRRENIIFVGIGAVYVKQILFTEIFMSFVFFFIRQHRVLNFFLYNAVPPVIHNFRFKAGVEHVNKFYIKRNLWIMGVEQCSIDQKTASNKQEAQRATYRTPEYNVLFE